MTKVLATGSRGRHSGNTSTPRLLHELFERRAAELPGQIAVRCGAFTLSYDALDRAANRLARRLRSAGVGRGDHVGIFLPRSAEVYVAILAILKCGAAYVPLDPDYPRERVAYILQDCRAHSLITISALAPTAVDFVGNLLKLDTLEGELCSESNEPIPHSETLTEPCDVAYVIYTSGTTGRPKGVQIEHRSVCHFVRAEAEVFEVESSDQVYQGFSIAFDASVEEVWLAFFAGATLVVGTKEMVQAGPALSRLLTEAGVTVFSTVPTLLSLLEGNLPTVRLLILGGEACPPDLVSRWGGAARRMVNTYGPTEATVVATYADCQPGQPVTIGRPLPGYTIYLIDEHKAIVADGEVGEIYIGGPGVARGYVGLPALSLEKFVVDRFAEPLDASKRLYRSGDLGRLNASGDLEFLGRADTQIKLRGFRIELTEIESVLIECPGVRACAVAIREDLPGIPQLVAYVVPSDKRRIDSRALLTSLRGRLPAYMMPTRLEVTSSLPTLPSGKVDRQRLPAPRIMPAESLSATETDANSPIERTLARAWSKLFAPMEVSIADDFFRDLGGHSLLAARMVSVLRSGPEFRKLSVLDVYNYPTIEGLAARIEKDRLAAIDEEVEKADDQGPSQFRKTTDRAFALCGVIQAFGVYLILGFFSLQWLAPYLTYTWLIEHDTDIFGAILGSMAILLGLYPTMLAASIAIKWLVVGRYKAGEYPLWGGMYLRWWFVEAIQASVPIGYLAGTPLLGWYYRLLGAKIGTNVHIGSDSLAAFDLISIGDDTCIGCDTDISGCTVEDGVLKIGAVSIGRNCFVGNRAVIRENTVIEDAAKLEDLSLLPAGGRIPAGERWAGSPARRVARRASWTGKREGSRPSLAKRFAFGLLHLVGQFVFPIMVIAAIFPGIILMNELNYRDDYYWYLFLAPLVALSFVILLCLEIALVKWVLLGRIKPGRYDLHSGFYVRKWFVDQLMELSLDVIGPLYATIYLAPWYRLLGAKLGRRAEVSTASFLSPDLLHVADEGFIADAVSLGAARVEDGTVTIDKVVVGKRAFIGNSALLPPGAVIGENALIGCLSTTPANYPGARAEGSAWIGSPAVFLPTRQESTAFEVERTFKPNRKLWIQRGLIEFCRVILPSTLFIILTSFLLSCFLLIHDQMPLPSLLLVFPLLYLVIGLTASLIVVGFKWILMGRYRPAEYPLWNTFVWKTELVTALYENLARLFLIDKLQGTPFLAAYLRLLGARIGKRVFLNTAEFTEFDLVEIGDDAVLNSDCTIQTHLFEDRVLKMSSVRVGDKCSVGSQAVVLYDTEMSEGSSLDGLSLLMKGEVLPPWSRWEGSPARPQSRSPTKEACRIRSPIA